MAKLLLVWSWMWRYIVHGIMSPHSPSVLSSLFRRLWFLPELCFLLGCCNCHIVLPTVLSQATCSFKTLIPPHSLAPLWSLVIHLDIQRPYINGILEHAWRVLNFMLVFWPNDSLSRNVLSLAKHVSENSPPFVCPSPHLCLHSHRRVIVKECSIVNKPW